MKSDERGGPWLELLPRIIVALRPAGSAHAASNSASSDRSKIGSPGRRLFSVIIRGSPRAAGSLIVLVRRFVFFAASHFLIFPSDGLYPLPVVGIWRPHRPEPRPLRLLPDMVEITLHDA